MSLEFSLSYHIGTSGSRYAVGTPHPARWQIAIPQVEWHIAIRGASCFRFVASSLYRACRLKSDFSWLASPGGVVPADVDIDLIDDPRPMTVAQAAAIGGIAPAVVAARCAEHAVACVFPPSDRDG